jgi:hypothetical protein
MLNRCSLGDISNWWSHQFHAITRLIEWYRTLKWNKISNLVTFPHLKLFPSMKCLKKCQFYPKFFFQYYSQKVPHSYVANSFSQSIMLLLKSPYNFPLLKLPCLDTTPNFMTQESWVASWTLYLLHENAPLHVLSNISSSCLYSTEHCLLDATPTSTEPQVSFYNSKAPTYHEHLPMNIYHKQNPCFF